MDSHYFTAFCYETIKKGLPNAKLKDAERLVNWVRVVKSNAEIKLMQSAARIVESGMKTAFKSINPGVRQCDAVADIQKALFTGTKEFGGDYPSIATLLPTGKGTSASHLTHTDEKFVSGEATIIEIAGAYKRYHCPMARTVLLGEKDQKKIKHHLFGIVDVRKRFSTGQWLKKCIKIINLIRKKNKIPIIVGGTGLYFKALVDGLVSIPKLKPSEKNKILKLHKKLGQKQFYKKLVKLDPVSKKFINSNDVNRSIRAYEVKKLTKKSLYKWFKETKTFFDKNEFVMTYVDYPRDKLIKNIKKRIDRMFDLGAIKEVKKFNLIKINKLNSVNHVIGIKEINSFLSKKAELNDIKEQILIKTRQYAKRQSTWSRGHMINWHKIDPKSKNPFKKILK